MHCITLWQPWASLWLTTAKVHETRPWSTHYRGELGVHSAARTLPPRLDKELHEICVEYLGPSYRNDLLLGAILGVVQLIDCVPSETHGPIDRTDRICGDFGPGRFLWKRGQFLTLARPIFINGHQKLWNGPKHILGAR